MTRISYNPNTFCIKFINSINFLISVTLNAWLKKKYILPHPSINSALMRPIRPAKHYCAQLVIYLHVYIRIHVCLS